MQVMILSQDSDRGRISLSTKKLEPTPGDMLRNPQLVFDKVSHIPSLLHLALCRMHAPLVCKAVIGKATEFRLSFEELVMFIFSRLMRI